MTSPHLAFALAPAAGAGYLEFRVRVRVRVTVTVRVKGSLNRRWVLWRFGGDTFIVLLTLPVPL